MNRSERWRGPWKWTHKSGLIFRSFAWLAYDRDCDDKPLLCLCCYHRMTWISWCRCSDFHFLYNFLLHIKVITNGTHYLMEAAKALLLSSSASPAAPPILLPAHYYSPNLVLGVILSRWKSRTYFQLMLNFSWRSRWGRDQHFASSTVYTCKATQKSVNFHTMTTAASPPPTQFQHDMDSSLVFWRRTKSYYNIIKTIDLEVRGLWTFNFPCGRLEFFRHSTHQSSETWSEEMDRISVEFAMRNISWWSLSLEFPWPPINHK